MEKPKKNHQVPVFSLAADNITANKHFRMYHFEGSLPNRSDLLVPHRKDYYLIAFVRRGGNRQWIDFTPYPLKENTIYFTGPGQIIVKEGFEQLWSTGIAFTTEFLLLQENASLRHLPLISNPRNGHELLLSEADILFVEDLLAKLNAEYQSPSEWQSAMLSAYLTVLLTYLSRLYTDQFPADTINTDKGLVKAFQEKIEECFRELYEVGDYAGILHISAGHLSEVIKMQSGRPAIKHIHERRILEAKRMLFHTSMSLKEIAFDLGFAEHSYFNRFFKRETGITPSQYRSGIRKMYH